MLNKLIDIGLRNRMLVLVLGLLVLAGGWYAAVRLPVDAFPDVSPNLVQVFTVTEGLAPEEIETFVTYPVEAALTGLPGVVRVRSVSNFGLSVVNIYFEDGMDIYFARQLVGERLQEARERIPEGFGSPEMGPISTGMGQVLFYYMEDTTGEFDLTELRSIQDWLVKFHLQTVPGVTEVLGIGGYEKQFHVDVRPEQLLRYDVTLGEILERIEANNLNVGAQFIEKNSEEFVVRSIGLTRNIADLERIVIKTDDGRPLFLADLASIRTGGAVRRGVQTRNGTGEVVAGQVIKLIGTNSSKVIADVEAKMDEINRILPTGVKLVPYYEQKSLVTAAIRTVSTALLQGVALIALVLLAFMGGLRPSLVVALSLPFSLFFAVLLMGRFGLTANLMSLGGLAIAIGMMVDGTIVMVENVARHLRRAGPEADRTSVISTACREVGRPVAFASGSRGQDLPSAGPDRGAGNAGFADLCFDPSPGPQFCFVKAFKINCIRAMAGPFSQPWLPSPRRRFCSPGLAFDRDGGRAVGGGCRDCAAHRVGVHAAASGRHGGGAPDHGAFHLPDRKHRRDRSRGKTAARHPRDRRGGQPHRTWGGRRPHRPRQLGRDVCPPRPQGRVADRPIPGGHRTRHPR